MASIIAFLEARIAEDEQVARAATAGPWKWEEGQAMDESFLYAPDEVPVILGLGMHAPGFLECSDEDRTHIAAHDPSRVLAECAAKRAILSGSHWEPRERPTDSELHFRGSHPAYQYKTTEGQRKAWDDADEPPEGEGWERNTDSGRDGWDRFEFHEESYWRRLKPESERKEWKQWIPKELRAIASVYKDHPDYQQDWAL